MSPHTRSESIEGCRLSHLLYFDVRGWGGQCFGPIQDVAVCFGTVATDLNREGTAPGLDGDVTNGATLWVERISGMSRHTAVSVTGEHTLQVFLGNTRGRGHLHLGANHHARLVSTCRNRLLDERLSGVRCTRRQHLGDQLGGIRRKLVARETRARGGGCRGIRTPDGSSSQRNE